MEVQPATLALGALVDAARKHDAAPTDLLLIKFPFESPLGRCHVRFTPGDVIDGGSDRWLGGFLYWSGPKEAAPVNASFAFELAAVKEAGCHGLGGVGDGVDDPWQNGLGWGDPRLCEWSQLRRAVLDGCSLRLTVVVLDPSDAPATLDTALRIQNNASDTSALLGALLDGPFTDVAVTAGGRTFRAHRVVLAAASPVFLGMLDGDMREAREAAVELVGADAGAVELLLRHLYGGTIEVPVSSALQLYALADQYQVAGGPQQRLRLWLMALQLAPEALCELVPAARTLCPAAYSGRLLWQAAENLDQLSSLRAFAGWPLDTVVEAMTEEAAPLPAFNAAVAWVEAQPRRAKQRRNWMRLLDAVPWVNASRSDLWAMQQHPSACQVPGLEKRLLVAYHELCKRLEASSDSESD